MYSLLYCIYYFLGQKPHECNKCGKRFASGCNMKAHMKTHENPATKLNIQRQYNNLDELEEVMEDDEIDVEETLVGTGC